MQEKITSIILIVLCAFLSAKTSNAQNQNFIEGVVYENTKGVPMLGATVMMMNDNDRILGGTVTNAEGNFRIAVPAGTTRVRFTFIGMKGQTYAYIPGRKYEIVLKEDNETLEEVVVQGTRARRPDFGMLQKDKRDMSNAVTIVDMKQLENQPVSSVEQLLQGAAPGLQVTFNSGDPGAGASIRIRGISSLEGNNKPLWIIDGAEVIGDDFDVSSITNFGTSPIGDIDPSDIESITVLKDASSTAIYGSRGANGVIVITTKKGVKGKPKFSFAVKYNTSLIQKRIPMLNGDQQRMYILEAQMNASGTDDPNNLPMLRGDLTREDAWKYNNNTDMVDMLSRVGFQQNYNASLRGGGERLMYYWSLTYDKEYGTTKGGGYDRFTTIVNLDYRLSSKFKISTKFQYANSLTDKRSWDWPIMSINALGKARARAAFLPVYSRDGKSYFIENSGDAKHPSIATKMYNPIAMIDDAKFQEKANRFNAILNLDLNLSSMWNISTQVAVDYRQNGNEFFGPSSFVGNTYTAEVYNYGLRDDNYKMQISNNNRLIFTGIDKENHLLRLIAVADLKYRTSSSTLIRYSRGAANQMQGTIGAASMVNAEGGNTTSSEISLVADLHYRLLNRYNVNLSLKTEGSSQYGKDNPFSIFPTVGVAWNLDKEAFLRDKEWAELLKLRFAYGVTGRLPNVTNLLSVTYATAQDGYMGNSYSYMDKFAYDNLHEERTTQYNYGMDWTLFGGRFSGEANYYKGTTEGLLLKENMSTSTGFAERYVNFGSLQNKGWELGFTVIPVKLADNFQWKVYFSISRNKGKLLSMPERLANSDNKYTEPYGYGNFRAKLEKGSVVGGFFGLKALGVYARDEDAVVKDFNGNIVYNADGTPKKLTFRDGSTFSGGDMIYEDINHDGVINDLDVVQIGDANVGYFGLFRHDITYKQWALGLAFYYSLGQDVINGMRYSTENMEGSNNQATSIQRRWRKQGDITDMPRAIDKAARNYEASTRWVEDASYLKLKEISLTYSFKREWLKKIHLNQLSAFVTGTNVFTWSKYRGIDPEIGLTSGKLVKIGIDHSNTAPPIQIMFGIRAQF